MLQIILVCKLAHEQYSINGLDELKVPLYDCPIKMTNGIHSDHRYLDTEGDLGRTTLKYNILTAEIQCCDGTVYICPNAKILH